MSIFIPNRAIKLPKDISEVQDITASVKNLQKRDSAFIMGKRFDGSLADKVTNTKAQCTISGTRYGIVNGVVNGVVTAFAPNVPPVEDKGLRGCPAFTQLARYTEDFTNAAWSKINILTPTLVGTFQGQNIWALIENTATNVAHSFIDSTAFTGAADNSVMGISLIAKNNGRLLEIIGRIKDGSYPVVCWLNLQTGIISNLRAGSVASCVDIGNGFYRIFATLPVGVGAQTSYLYIQLYNGSSNIYTGDGVSGILVGQPTFINFGVNGTPFLPPYVPNNTTSSVSVVSEAATSTTGTSFDLDDVKLVKFKEGLRGKAVGSNLWTIPVLMTPPWTDNGTHYVCDGTNNSATLSCTGVLSTGKLYEITFTTGAVTGGVLSVWVGGILIFNSTPTAGTTYTLRTATPTASTNATFTNSNAFIGQIRKDIVVKEVQAQGHIELEFESKVDSEWLPSGTDCNILSCRNALTSLLRYRKYSDGSTVFGIIDSADNVCNSQIMSVSPGKIFSIVIDYGTYTDGTQKMRLTVNGVKSSVVAFSGSFGSQDLRFFYSNTVHAGWIKDLKYYERPQW